MAYFNDKEISENNIYTAGTLDFSLHSGQNNFVSGPGVGGARHRNRVIQVRQDGNIPFKYTIQTEITGGDSAFCGTLELEAKLRGEIKYPVAGGSGSLTDFDLLPPIDMIDPPGIDTWQFRIDDPGDSQNETCEFKFIFEGWQDNAGSYKKNGFYDVEEIENSFSSSEQQNSNRLRVDHPNGGEVWCTVPDFYVADSWCENYGDLYGMDNRCRYHIRWSTDIPEGEGSVDIWFCDESGKNCFYHITEDGPTENDGIYEWRVPFDDRFIGDEDRIKIVISGISGGGSVWDMTDEDFCPLVPPYAPSSSDPELFTGEADDSETEENIGGEETGEPDGLDEDEDEMEDTSEEDEDAKKEEFVLTPKKGILLDDDDGTDGGEDGDDDAVADDGINSDEEESFEELESELKSDVEEEIEKINNDSSDLEDEEKGIIENSEELSLDVKKEIEEINNDNAGDLENDNNDSNENNLNKNSVDCVQAAK